jgi:hypothetical protein
MIIECIYMVYTWYIVVYPSAKWGVHIYAKYAEYRLGPVSILNYVKIRSKLWLNILLILSKFCLNFV